MTEEEQEELVSLLAILNSPEPSGRYFLARGRATNLLKELEAKP